MAGERLVLVGVLALTVVLSGCVRGESPPSGASGDGGPPRQRSKEIWRIETTLALTRAAISAASLKDRKSREFVDSRRIRHAFVSLRA